MVNMTDEKTVSAKFRILINNQIISTRFAGGYKKAIELFYDLSKRGES